MIRKRKKTLKVCFVETKVTGKGKELTLLMTVILSQHSDLNFLELPIKPESSNINFLIESKISKDSIFKLSIVNIFVKETYYIKFSDLHYQMIFLQFGDVERILTKQGTKYKQ